ncbi:unnamed protein product [Pipistrellus nathusii]|uniref:Uncharacterized protein n=1 Tax=Pipistrellus nathusii TaxID=59473 RepID=A0ABP0AA39_PIPNA
MRSRSRQGLFPPPPPDVSRYKRWMCYFLYFYILEELHANVECVGLLVHALCNTKSYENFVCLRSWGNMERVGGALVMMVWHSWKCESEVLAPQSKHSSLENA